MNQFTLIPFHHPVTATITVPGSKSYTNRALILGALCDAPVRLVNPLFSDDTEAMVECLRALGVDIEVSKNDIVIIGNFTEVKEKTYKLNARLSGTTIRFITAFSILVPGTKIIYGAKRLNERPIGDLVEGLRQLGAQIEYMEKEGYPPVKVVQTVRELSLRGAERRSNLSFKPRRDCFASLAMTKNESSDSIGGVKKIAIHGATSSQFLSALLMIAPFIAAVTIKVKGAQISASYIDITLDIMRQFGVEVETRGYKEYCVASGQRYTLPAGAYTIEGDYSAAAYFFAIAALTKSTITVQNLNPRSAQGDRLFLDVLKKMGNTVVYGKNEVTVRGKGVKPLPKVNMLRMPDQAQTLAVLAAFAKGKTTLTGIRSLRIKETERVQALQTELKKMGIKTESTRDTLTIYGGNPRPAVIDTYNDHRMAMSFAVAGSKLNGMKINNPEVVNKTFPEFWDILGQVGMRVKFQ